MPCLRESKLCPETAWSDAVKRFHGEAILALLAPSTPASPDNRILKASLFWDGGKVWKLRFSPDEAGTWLWSVESADAGLDGQSGRFTCVPSVSRGGIRPMTGYTRHFQYQNGEPYRLFGDTHWSVFGSDPEYNWDRTAFKRYVDVRASQGFNFVHGIITSPRRGNEGGEMLGTLIRETLNPAFFQDVDSRVAYLNQKGITAMISLSGSKRQGYGLQWREFPSDDARLRFARSIASRYGAYNVCFGVMGEWEADKEELRTLYPLIGQSIYDTDPYGRMITMHPQGNPGTVRECAAEQWHAFGDYMQNYGGLHQDALDSYETAKPVVNSEYSYYLRDADGDGNVDKKHGWDVESIRIATYDIAMAAAYFVIAFGSTYWGGYRNPAHGFDVDNPQNEPWESDARYVHRLFTSLEWWKLHPNDSLLIGSGKGRLYRLAEPGRQYLAYVRNAKGRVSLRLNAGKHNPYTLRRFGPRTGEYTDLGKYEGRGPVTLTRPDDEDPVFLLISDDIADIGSPAPTPQPMSIGYSPGTAAALAVAGNVRSDIDTVLASSSDPDPMEMILTVNNGSGDGAYNEGDSVRIQADRAPFGQVFDKWTGGNGYIRDVYAARSKITIPDANATVTATYRDKSSCGIADIDRIRTDIMINPTGASNVRSRRAALHRWWRLLWHQGYDMNRNNYDATWNRLLINAATNAAALEAVNDAYAAMEDIMAGGTIIPEVAGTPNQSEPTTKTDWPVYHGTDGNQTGYSSDAGPSRGRIAWRVAKGNFGMRIPSSKTAESIRPLQGQT